MPKGASHLFITHRRGATWTTPRDLGSAINGITPHNSEARLLPGRLCYDSTMTLYCVAEPRPFASST